MTETIPSDRVYAKSESVVFRRIADECLLVPIRKTSKDVDSFFRLNETATRIWELIDGNSSLEHITNALAEEFGVSRDICTNDVLEFICQLEHIQAVTFTGSGERD